MENNDLNFVTNESKKRTDADLVPNFGGLSFDEVSKIAETNNVGIWSVDNFTLEEVDLMIERPVLYAGKDIPNQSELFELAKILRARKSVEQ